MHSCVYVFLLVLVMLAWGLLPVCVLPICGYCDAQGMAGHCALAQVAQNTLIYVQEILEVEQLMGDEDIGLELTEDNVERSLDEIRSVSQGPACPLLLHSVTCKSISRARSMQAAAHRQHGCCLSL